MNIVNIGTDKTLVGGKRLGDAIERHRRYGEFVDQLDVIVYTNKKEGLQEFSIAENVIGHPSNSRAKIFFCRNALKIFAEIQKKHPVDIVQCQDPFLPALIGWRLKKKFGIKLQINFHGDFWSNPSWLKERRFNWLFLLISKFTVPRADGIRVMSEGQKQKLIKAGIDYKKIRVISTPVNLDKFGNGDSDNGQRKIILHIGRDDEVKDYDTLIKAFKLVREKVSDAIFWQAGADTELAKAMRNNNFQDVVALGMKSHDDLMPLMQQSTVFTLSSTSESFGKVLVEANACAKPVVSTATTGAKEIIRDGFNGFLVPIGDSSALAEKIIWLLENPDQAKEIGQNGQKLMQDRFSDNTEKIVSFWRDIKNNNL